MNQNNENTSVKVTELKKKMEDLKFERDKNQAIALRNLQKAEKYSQLWYRKRILHKYYEHFKNNWLAKKEAKTFIKTKVEKFNYNHTSLEQLKERVDMQIETELEHKKYKLSHLEILIREFEEQYKIQLQKRALIKNVCDDGMQRGSMKMSADALRMSMSTLRDLESKFMKTYQMQIESQQKSTASKLEKKMVFQRVTQ